MPLKLSGGGDVFPLAQVFTISRGSKTEAQVVSVELTDGTHSGRGECVPYARYGESIDSVLAEVAALDTAIADGLTRQELQTRMKPGAARNAIDCAFWDLTAKQAGKPVYELAGLPMPGPVETAYTLSLAPPEQLVEDARAAAHRPLLKVKLGADGDVERIRAVRDGAPASRIIVDANEGWSVDDYNRLAPEFLRLGVAMVEQPFPAGDDDVLADIDRVLPVCADESCHDAASLPALTGKYDMVNIKLDKTGGLTEALKLRDAARAAGFQIMVGCMVGSSLAMAPAHLVAQGAEIIDLDGPLLLAKDREPAIHYDGSIMHAADRALWG